MIVLPKLDATQDPRIIVGRHSLWVPPPVYEELLRAAGIEPAALELEMPFGPSHDAVLRVEGAVGLKVPFQHHGELVKYTRPTERRYAVFPSLQHEVTILKALGAVGMAPPVGAWVRIGTLVSWFGRPEGPEGACGTLGPAGASGGREAALPEVDPMGAFGYEFADATCLPTEGAFIASRMRHEFHDRIAGSEGAWNDLLKPGNVVHGYLIDVRRSGFDMLRWVGGLVPAPPGALRVPPGALPQDEAIR